MERHRRHRPAEGRNLILRTAEAGELLGASAVISHREYETSVETVEPCQVNFIRAEDFLNMITNDKEAMLSAAVSYYLFAVLLGVPLPSGPWPD